MKTTEQAQNYDSEQAFIVKQPIFDRDKNIWGYGMLANTASSSAGNSTPVCLSDLINSSKEQLNALGEEFGAQKKILLQLSDKEVFSEELSPVDWQNVVVNFNNDVAQAPTCSNFALDMKNCGAILAINTDIDSDTFNKLAEISDIITIPMTGKTPQEIIQIRRNHKSFPGQFLAFDIDTWETYIGARALGFNYFQGPFFSVAQIKKDEKLSPNALSTLNLLRQLGDPACELNDLSEIIFSDVSLSYRLLKYINSASFGLRNEIKSIPQAVSLLGLNEVRHWATVTVMTGLNNSPIGWELSYFTLQRGRFLGALAESTEGITIESKSMFLLGLFSKLDAMLSYPMTKILCDIPLDTDMKDGLCGVANEYNDWIKMLNAVEQAEWNEANAILSQYGADFTQAATHYLRASNWAATQISRLQN